MIPEFFDCLEDEINNGEHKELWRNIGNTLLEYKKVFQLLMYVPHVGVARAKVAVFILGIVGKILSKEKSIEKKKKNLEEALLKQNQRIIVVIDDIDRLDNAHIRNLFQLVKQVGDFSNITYVLLMDKNVVAKALEDVQKGDGHKYIEKIIQIPINIPEISAEKLNEYFLGKLNEIVGEDDEVDSNYWQTIYHYCVRHCLENLRDVNRLINVLTFKTKLFMKEVCVEDIIALSAIELKEPGLYDWIANNKELLCGGGMHYAYMYNRKPEDIRKEYENQMVNVVSDVKWVIECLAVLFPVFARDTNEYITGGGMNDSEPELRARKRVSSEDRFKLYFGMDVEEVPITRNRMKQIALELNLDQIQEVMESMIKSNNITYFLDELRAIENTIPDERVELLMDVILKFKVRLWCDSNNLFLKGKDSYRAQFIFDDLFKRMPVDVRYNYLCTRINEADDDELEALGEKVNELLMAYGLIGENPRIDDTKKLIPLEKVQRVEETFRNRIELLSRKSTIHLEKELRNIEFYWLNRDEQGHDKYLKALFRDKVVMLKYVAKRVGNWSNSRESGYTYRNSDIEKYISLDEVKKTIENYDKTQMINEFSENQLMKLATLMLEDSTSEENVSLDRARRLVEEWASTI